MGTSAELDVALRAAEQAAAILRRYFEVGVRAELKGERDQVSVADREAEAVVRQVITGAFPGDVIVGEEGHAPAEVDVAGQRRWYVDPLDGTTNFLKGWERWAVSIGFCDSDGVLTAGVVAEPLSGALFSAVRDGGAWRNGSPIAVSAVTELSSALLVTGTRPQVLADITRLWPTVLTGRVTGSTALDLCDVAQGRADIHISSHQGRWDLAAGTLIAAEAGALVLGPDLKPTSGPVDGCVVLPPALLDALGPFLHPQRN